MARERAGGGGRREAGGLVQLSVLIIAWRSLCCGRGRSYRAVVVVVVVVVVLVVVTILTKAAKKVNFF